jgi:hypothetical protein
MKEIGEVKSLTESPPGRNAGPYQRIRRRVRLTYRI